MDDVIVDSTKFSTFGAFSNMYGKYPDSMAATYLIVKDTIAKGKGKNVKIIDGEELNIDSYVIECNTADTLKQRVLIPLSADADVDLIWWEKTVSHFKQRFCEVYMCIYTEETVRYVQILHS